jgi:hypothetical protein
MDGGRLEGQNETTLSDRERHGRAASAGEPATGPAESCGALTLSLVLGSS